MEHSQDSKFEESGDSENSKLKNSKNSNSKIGGKTTLKNAIKFSPSHKNFKYSQNNTIKKWITKDFSGHNKNTSSNQSYSKQKNKKEISIYDIGDNETCTSNIVTKIREKEKYCMKKNNEKRKKNTSTDSHIKESNNLKKSMEGSSNPKNKKKSHIVDRSDTEITSTESMARKKFKTMRTPISLKTLTDEKLNVNPTKSKSNQYNGCSASFRKDNKKQSVVPTKQYNSPEWTSSIIKSPKPTPVAATRKLFDMFAQSDAIDASIKKNTGKNEDKYKETSLKSITFNAMVGTSKCSSEVHRKTNGSNSEINMKKKSKENDKADTSKQNEHRLKSPKHIVNTSRSSTKQLTWLTKDTKRKKHGCKSNGSDSKDKRNIEKSKRKEKKVVKQTLDNFLTKNDKEEYSRSEPNENCEFPSTANNKKKPKTNKGNDSFKKYGVTVPSVEEILREQQDLEQYKNQIESFKDIDDKFFELPFSIKDLKNKPVIDKNILDCKHLTPQDINEAFSNNLNYISDIFHGREYSERHDRFFERNNRNYAFTVKDLCYSTSTIVFTFEQKEQMLALLKKEFDPDDKKTLYFFQVLLPELCLKIFMDTHSMTYNQAVKYLDTRPILD